MMPVLDADRERFQRVVLSPGLDTGISLATHDFTSNPQSLPGIGGAMPVCDVKVF
jgi:hypothetical protein